MHTVEAKLEIIRRLELWIANAPKFAVPNNQYIEAKTLLMFCKADLINERGWDEVDFYLSMMAYSRIPEYPVSFSIIA